MKASYEKASAVFMGLVYIAGGFLILLRPRVLYYGVAAVFIVHGFSSLLQSWNRRRN
ncbi:MAG: hypothetical protein PHX45_11575 [Acidobacteriota bacterium]|nr:hypothetical protein [Acidobacteriota bacterium]